VAAEFQNYGIYYANVRFFKIIENPEASLETKSELASVSGPPSCPLLPANQQAREAFKARHIK
jgi:hypothetical protein